MSALPAGRSPPALVEVLDAALRRQGRSGEADRVRDEYGITRDDTDE
jgi:hypothetical protein